MQPGKRSQRCGEDSHGRGTEIHSHRGTQSGEYPDKEEIDEGRRVLLVSVVMPTYNCGKYITESLDSVIHQTITDWEVQIVDDCSTDDTVEVLQQYLEKYPNIHYCKLPKNGRCILATYEPKEKELYDLTLKTKEHISNTLSFITEIWNNHIMGFDDKQSEIALLHEA